VTPWVALDAGTLVSPSSTTTVTVTIPKMARPVSPYIFGVNAGSGTAANKCRAFHDEKLFRFFRLGGNQFSTYNWKTGVSNGGTDGSCNTNWTACGMYSASSCANGAAVENALSYIVRDVPQAVLMMTVPLAGAIATGCSGSGTFAQLTNGAPNYTLDTTYQTAFIDAMSVSPDPQFKWWQLDNEFEGWPSTHGLSKPDYLEVTGKMLSAAKYLKSKTSAGWKVMGPAAMSYDGIMTGGEDMDPVLNSNAWVEQHGPFSDYFLKRFKEASDTAGVRLLDAFDFHWYPQASGYPTVSSTTTSPTTAGAAMVLAEPRNLWDPTYNDKAWDTDALGNKQFIPRLRAAIEANFPGTAIGVTEWNLGYTLNAVGLVAHADALGLFAREGVSYANYWEMADGDVAVQSAFALYLSYDGHGASFGDVYLASSSTDADVAVHPSYDRASGVLKVVLLNRSASAKQVTVGFQSFAPLTQADVYTTAAASPFRPASVSHATAVTGGVLSVSLPGYSGTMVVAH
jgi:hypothetical protein